MMSSDLPAEGKRREPLFCGCARHCGDDGDTEGPGVCKGLPRQPEPPLVEIIMVPRDDPRFGGKP